MTTGKRAMTVDDSSTWYNIAKPYAKYKLTCPQYNPSQREV